MAQVFWEQEEFGKHCTRNTQSYSLTPGGTQGSMLTRDPDSAPSVVQGSQEAVPGAELRGRAGASFVSSTALAHA